MTVGSDDGESIAPQTLEGARARDRGLRRIVGNRHQRPARTGRSCRPGLQCFAESLVADGRARSPAANGLRRPLRRFLRVTPIAGVWRAELRRKIGTRNPQRMIMPVVDAHVGRRRHVAGNALRGPRSLRVVGVRGRVVFRRLMALRANVVAGTAELQRVRIMAVGAGDALGLHPALHERAPLVDLVPDLPVAPVEALVERGETMRVLQRLAMDVVVRDARGAGVTARAHVDFPRRRSRRAALRIAGRGHRRPRDAFALGQREREAAVGGRIRLAVALGARSRDMVGARAVTGFAGNVDLRPRRGEATRRCIEVLARAASNDTRRT